MNLLKLNLIALVSILTIGISNAKSEAEHAILTQIDNNKITLRAQADTDHPLRIEFTNNKGEVVFSDAIISEGLVLKTYDLSKTKVGVYNVAIFCDDNNFASTFISKDKVEIEKQHSLILE